MGVRSATLDVGELKAALNALWPSIDAEVCRSGHDINPNGSDAIGEKPVQSIRTWRADCHPLSQTELRLKIRIDYTIACSRRSIALTPRRLPQPFRKLQRISKAILRPEGPLIAAAM
jgi:hypothetical protein